MSQLGVISKDGKNKSLSQASHAADQTKLMMAQLERDVKVEVPDHLNFEDFS